MKIPLGSCKSYAKRNIPWESAKWDLQNKRCAKYTLEKRAHPNDTLLRKNTKSHKFCAIWTNLTSILSPITTA